ncbi:MAG: hypothetical protein AAF664_12305 [Planctomycetota bacterium]
MFPLIAKSAPVLGLLMLVTIVKTQNPIPADEPAMPETALTTPAILVDHLPITSIANQTVQVMEVPASLGQLDPLLVPPGSLMVVEVATDSLPQQWGLRAGMVIIAMDGLPLEPTKLAADWTILRSVEVLDALGPTRLTAPAALAVPGTILPAPIAIGVQNVSVSNVNGYVQIDATLSMPEGPKRYRMQGSPAQIDAKINALPADIGQVLRQSVGY